MIEVYARNWWVAVVRGIAAILFGVIAWFWPGLALQALIYLFAAYALIDGVLAFASLFTPRGRANWIWVIIEGILSIGAAVVAIAFPGLTALTFAIVIGIWAIILGVLRIIQAVQLRQVIDNEWSLGLSGLAVVIFGAILLIAPGAGVLSLLWLIGIWSIIFGVMMIVFGFRLRNHSSGRAAI